MRTRPFFSFSHISHRIVIPINHLYSLYVLHFVVREKIFQFWHNLFVYNSSVFVEHLLLKFGSRKASKTNVLFKREHKQKLQTLPSLKRRTVKQLYQTLSEDLIVLFKLTPDS